MSAAISRSPSIGSSRASGSQLGSQLPSPQAASGVPSLPLPSGGGGGALPLVGDRSPADTSRSTARSSIDGGALGHDEEEDELGVAKGSKYHAARQPGVSLTKEPRGGASSTALLSPSAAHPIAGRRSGAILSPHHADHVRSPSHTLAASFTAMQRLGISAGATTDEVALDIGGLETMPFQSTSTTIPKVVTAKGAGHGAAFLKSKEARLKEETPGRHANMFDLSSGVAALASASSSAGALSSRRSVGDTSRSFSSFPSTTTLADGSLGPDTMAQANRRELRAAMERKEEALAAARLRGASLLSFATSNAVTTVQGAPEVVREAPKPYIKYTPKYNLPYGDAPRQVAPPAATKGAGAAAAGGDLSPMPPSTSPGDDLAVVRSTTLFSVTGTLSTHVGVSLNSNVFSKAINQDAFTNTAAGPGAGVGAPLAHHPTTAAISGRRSANKRAPADASATHAQPPSNSGGGGAFPSWLQLAVPSLASSALPIGQAAATSTTGGGRKSAHGSHRSGEEKEEARRDGQGRPEEEEEEGDSTDPEHTHDDHDDGGDDGGTFLTGVNLSEEQKQQRCQEEQALAIRHASSSSSAAAMAAEDDDRVVTADDIRAFSTLTSVESAVTVLPRLLRPTRAAIDLAHQRQRAAAEAAGGGTVPSASLAPPALPYLDIPARVDLAELMQLSMAYFKETPTTATATMATPESPLSAAAGASTSATTNPASSASAGSPLRSSSFLTPASGVSGGVGGGGGAISSSLAAMFRSHFYSRESQLIIKDAYYWVLMHFFMPHAPTAQQQHQPSHAKGGGVDAKKKSRRSAGDARSATAAAATEIPEMYAYRSYASNLKKYAEQEGFLTRQREWVKECEKIRQQEKDSHAQIGTGVSGGAGGSGGGGGGGGGMSSSGLGSLSTLASSSSSSSSSHHHLPSSSPSSNKDDLPYPPAPVLTAKQKRQPLVLLGDIPHFDVQARLNTGPVPRDPEQGAFEVKVNQTAAAIQLLKAPTRTRAGASAGAPAAAVDYRSPSFLLSSLKSRISTHFVQLFLRIPLAHKDFFYRHYYDALAQIIYYAFLVAYPSSRPLINHAFFKVRLLQLTSHWILGYIPSNLAANLARWRGDIQFITGEAGVSKTYVPPAMISSASSKEGATSGRASASSSSSGGPLRLESADAEAAHAHQNRLLAAAGLLTSTSTTADDDDDEDDADEPTGLSALEEFAPQAHSSGGSSHPSHGGGGGGGGGHSHYVAHLEKRLNAHLASSSKTARAKVAAMVALQASAGTATGTLGAAQLLAAASSVSALSAPSAGGVSSTSPTKRTKLPGGGFLDGASPPVGGGGVVASSIGHLSSTTVELTGDLLVDVGQKAARNSHRVPLRVSRRKVDLHHSALIGDFLAQRHFAHQSNHALRIPLSVPATGDEDRGAFLDNLVAFNEAARTSTLELRSAYTGAKASFQRLQSKQRKEVAEIGRKFDQERERALREASAFSKTLVASYQETKYESLKAPSKSLALRRLGHFRQNKEGSGTASGSGTA